MLHQFSIIFLDVLGFILARDIFATEPYPPFAASVKDGYAVVGNAALIILELQFEHFASSTVFYLL